MLLGLRFSRNTLGPDLAAGLSTALVSIPEGMAYAMVANVNPVYGLYTGIVTTIVGSLFGSSTFMIVTLTNAMALVTADALGELSGDVQVSALFTLTLLVGLFQFALGVLKLGSVIRFVASEVMTGFVFATALLIVLGQYHHLAGYASQLDTNKLFRAVDITLHMGQWDLNTALVGVGSIIVLVLLKQSPLEKFADVIIVILSAVFVVLIGWQSVELVGDIATIPSSLPRVSLPDVSLIPTLIAGAVAAGIVGLSESAGISSAFPNPRGRRSDMSRDFLGQGLGNIAGSFFQAMPAGGSLSRTGVNVSGGAKSRWAGVYAGILLAVLVLLCGSLAELIPMSGLAGLLIVIGFGVMAKEWKHMAQAWRVSKAGSVAMIATILVGVFSDLTTAIFTGVALSLLLYVFKSSQEYEVLELVPTGDGRYKMQPTPAEMPSNEATVLSVQGSMYFASVYSLDDRMPSLENTRNAVVVWQTSIWRARGAEALSDTFVEWLEGYVEKLESCDSKLMLAGVTEQMMERLDRIGVVELIGEDSIFASTGIIGSSLDLALAAADKWLESGGHRAE